MQNFQRNRKNLRHKNHNYSEDGYYFVTICTHNRENFFGKIINGEMFLNGVGEIVSNEILNTEKIRKDVEIDEYIIMPNHLHLVIVINNSRRERLHRSQSFGKHLSKCSEKQFSKCSEKQFSKCSEKHCSKCSEKQLVSNNGNINIFPDTNISGTIQSFPTIDTGCFNINGSIGLKGSNLSSIIRGFKSTCTKQINQIYGSNIFNFAWQKSFHDRIIRNEKEFLNIKKYIQENPQKWELDENNPDNFNKNTT